MCRFFINTVREAKKKKKKDGRDQGNGTHLDHDIRALVNGHDRYVFLWLM